MDSGDLINEETIVPGGEKPVRSSIKGHHPEKTGVPAGRSATQATTAVENSLNADFWGRFMALGASFGTRTLVRI